MLRELPPLDVHTVRLSLSSPHEQKKWVCSLSKPLVTHEWVHIHVLHSDTYSLLHSISGDKAASSPLPSKFHP